MQLEPTTASRSPLIAVAAVLVGLGLANGLARLLAFMLLLAVVAATVGALAAGIVLLRLTLLH